MLCTSRRPHGFQIARDEALAYVSRPDNLPNADVLFNLGCAYETGGTEWIKTGHAAGEPASMQDRRDSALEVLAKAFALQPALKNRAREMISGQAKDDTDLNEMARDDPRFAKLIGLSA